MLNSFAPPRLPVTYISSPCLVVHRAFTEVFHCSLSAAAILVSSYDLHPASLRSFSTVRRHVVLGLPLSFPFSLWGPVVVVINAGIMCKTPLAINPLLPTGAKSSDPGHSAETTKKCMETTPSATFPSRRDPGIMSTIYGLSLTEFGYFRRSQTNIFIV